MCFRRVNYVNLKFMHFFKKVSLVGSALVVLAAVFVLGASFGLSQRPAISQVTDLVNKDQGMPEGVDFAPFWETWNLLNTKYAPAHAPKVSSTSLSRVPGSAEDKVYGAIQGMVASLGDPYTVFFPPTENEMFKDDLKGSFDGVGMEIGIKKGVLTVVAPLEGTPAKRAGMRPGDQVVQIDGRSTMDLTTEQAVRLIRGKKGTKVKLTVVREGATKPLEVELTRDTISLPTMKSESVNAAGKTDSVATNPNGAYVIKLYNFGPDSPNLFREGLRKFVESGGSKLVIDLRGNPGGYLEAAVDMASWFLPTGNVVVSEKFGKTGNEEVFRSKGYNLFTDKLKLAILIDKGSASASEILTGALKDYGKAIVLGEKSFGKGSVQEMIDVGDRSALKVTVARWYTPKGVSISDSGIVPDIEVKLSEDDFKSGKDPVMERAIKELSK